MRNFRSTARFLKGLRVDESGVKGALLEAHDCHPVRRGSGYMTRGAKLTLDVAGTQAAWGAWAVKLPLFDGMLVAATNDYADTTAGNDDTMFMPVTDPAATALSPAFLPGHPSNNAGAAITTYGSTSYGTRGSAAALGDELFIPAGNDLLPFKWAGRTPRTAYTTGTVTGSAGGTTLTGGGGAAWTTGTNARAGDYIWVNAATVGGRDRWYRIVRVTGATTLIIDAPLDVALAGVAYRIDAAGPWAAKPGTFGLLGAAATIANHSFVNLRWACTHLGRLFGGWSVDVDNVEYPDRMRWCATAREVSGKWIGGDYWHPAAYVDVAPGRDAGTLAGISVGRTLMVFKRGSVYAFRGDVETDGRDVGASLGLVTDEDGLYGAQPVAVPGGGALFAGRRGLWLLTESGARNVTAEAGLSALWDELLERALPVGYDFGTPIIPSLSIINDRVIVQFGRTSLAYDRSQDSTDPNTLVWHVRDNLWTTQLTHLCTPIVALGGSEVAFNRNPASFVASGHFTWWEDDYETRRSNPLNEDSLPATLEEQGVAPLMRLTTHTVSVAEPHTINGRLRAAQVKARIEPLLSRDDVVAASNPVAWFDVDEPSGSVVDSIAGLLGTVNGNPARGVPGFDGEVGAIDLDGTGDFIEIPSSPIINTAQFTVGMWIRRDVDTGGIETLIDSATAVGSRGYELRIGSGDLLAIMLGDGAAFSVVNGVNTITPGVWYWVVVTYDGANVRVFLDGAPEVGPIADGYLPNLTDSTLIGAFQTTAGVLSRYFNGAVDEPTFWNTALSPATILSLYESLERPTDPEVHVQVLLGEEGTNTSVEAAITADDVIDTADDGGETERWYRVPIRDGTPPVDQVRVRLMQQDPMDKLIVYEAGVEVLGVGRVRP